MALIDVDGQEVEAGRHVEVRDAASAVAGKSGLDGDHQRAVAVEYVEDAVEAIPERPAEVGAVGVVACQLEGREAAVDRLHAGERERVRDAQVPASRRRAARVVAAGLVGVSGGRG